MLEDAGSNNSRLSSPQAQKLATPPAAFATGDNNQSQSEDGGTHLYPFLFRDTEGLTHDELYLIASNPHSNT